MQAETTQTAAPKRKSQRGPFYGFNADKAYTYLMDRFLLRLPVDQRVMRFVQGKGGSYFGGRGRAWNGARMRVEEIETGVVGLYSYNMILAAWVGNNLLLNADGVDSQQTNQHQRTLRQRVEHLNGIRHVSCPDPFELWTNELRARYDTAFNNSKAEWAARVMKERTEECGFKDCSCTHDNKDGICKCEPVERYLPKDKETVSDFEWRKVPVEQHEYQPFVLKDNHRFYYSDEYKALEEWWKADPEWKAHSNRWHMEKKAIEAKHEYNQKIAAHCCQCGAEYVMCQNGLMGCPTHLQYGEVELTYSMIPFSVLGYDTMSGRFAPNGTGWHGFKTAGVRLKDVEVVHATPDFKIKRTETRTFRRPLKTKMVFGVERKGHPEPWKAECGHCKQPFGSAAQHVHDVEVEHHFLGELLFRVNSNPLADDPIDSEDFELGSNPHVQPRDHRPKYSYYVSGLDRNDNPQMRKFFLARLPLSIRAEDGFSTVDEALDALRPAYLPANTPRQGEWFFVKADAKTAKLVNKKIILAGTGDEVTGFGEQKQVPIVSDKANDQWSARKVDRSGRHVAFRMRGFAGKVYVKGKIRDREHDTLDLGDRWHKVVRNLADGAWSFEPGEKRVRVD